MFDKIFTDCVASCLVVNDVTYGIVWETGETVMVPHDYDVKPTLSRAF